MRWHRVLERHGYQVQNEEGVEYDPFMLLAQQSGDKSTKVAVFGHTSTDYSQQKCGVSVEIICPQDEKHMNLAAECGFRKMVELVNDMASHVGLPPFPVPDEQ